MFSSERYQHGAMQARDSCHGFWVQATGVGKQREHTVRMRRCSPRRIKFPMCWWIPASATGTMGKKPPPLSSGWIVSGRFAQINPLDHILVESLVPGNSGPTI